MNLDTLSKIARSLNSPIDKDLNQRLEIFRTLNDYNSMDRNEFDEFIQANMLDDGIGNIGAANTQRRLKTINKIKKLLKRSLFNDYIALILHTQSKKESAINKYGNILHERKLASLPMSEKVEYLKSLLRA